VLSYTHTHRHTDTRGSRTQGGVTLSDHLFAMYGSHSGGAPSGPYVCVCVYTLYRMCSLTEAPLPVPMCVCIESVLLHTHTNTHTHTPSGPYVCVCIECVLLHTQTHTHTHLPVPMCVCVYINIIYVNIIYIQIVYIYIYYIYTYIPIILAKETYYTVIGLPCIHTYICGKREHIVKETYYIGKRDLLYCYRLTRRTVISAGGPRCI
jgi:hypothetical protein